MTIDSKTITSVLVILIPFVIGFLLKFISTIGTLDVEKLLLSKEKLLLIKTKNIINESFFLTFVAGYFLLLLELYKNTYKTIFAHMVSYLLLSFLLFLLISIFATAIFNNKSPAIAKIKSIIRYQKYFPIINLIMILSSAIFSAFIIAALFVGIYDGKERDYKLIVAILIFAYGIFIASYRFFKYNINLYSNILYRVSFIKASEGDFRDLYLYGANDDYIVMGKEKKYIGANEFIVLKKEMVHFYHIKREQFFWGNERSKPIEIQSNDVSPAKPDVNRPYNPIP